MYREEYPRPELVRESFLNLNGSWQFAFDYNKVGREKHWENRPEVYRETIEVPFCPESALSGLSHTDFINACWYRRTFCVPSDWEGRILLHFEAAYYHTEVFINGISVGTHDGGYTPFCFDITNLLKREGENVLTVYCTGDVRTMLEPSGKQSKKLNSAGCHYTRSTGIWQTVWLECVPAISLAQMKLDPDPDNSRLTAHLHFTANGWKKITLNALYQGKSVGMTRVETSLPAMTVQLSLTELHLWNPEEPSLYDLEISVESESGCDRVGSYFGMRKVEFDRKGLKLNGRYIFMRLVLDQGYYPDGVYTAPNDEALIRDIRISKRLGFNGARLHEKVFERRFLYHCDRLGYLVWGEYPSWGFDYSDAANTSMYCREWLESVNRDYNHPAVIGWCPMNENWGAQSDELVRSVYEVTKQIDAYRPVIDVSWNFHVMTDIYDTHDYEQDEEKFKERYARFEEGVIPDILKDQQRLPYNREMPYFLSEYGGIKWSEDDSGWGYGEAPKTEEEFEARFCTFARTLLGNPDICGFCYTQLYDIEQEQNGLYRYSREAKFVEDRLDRMAKAVRAPAAIEE